MTASRRSRAAEVVLGWPRWITLSLSFALFVIVVGLPTIIIPLATDQVLYALGARTILDGGQLYEDFWEIKPPLVFFIYVVPFALVGEHMEAIRVLDLINTGLAMGAVYFLTKRFFSDRAAILGATLYAFTYLTWLNVTGLAEAESFMAVPLALAFVLYRPDDEARDAPLRAATAGLLLGVLFSLKATAFLFVLGLPAAEFLLRDPARWSLRGAVDRMALAAGGFLLVQAVVVVYLASAGVLGDFLDIQRNYTADYSRYRYSEGAHVRFLFQTTATWITGTSYLLVPAAGGLLLAFFRPRAAPGAWLLGLLAALGIAGIWWQGKMFDYHWIVLVPLLAPLAGYALDQLLNLFGTLPRRQAISASALVALGLGVLAFEPLLDTYDDYRTLISYADGTLSRRDVENRYFPLLERNHQVVDYVKANGAADDRLFVWGLWPQTYFWLDRPLVDRFVANHGLRSTWAPRSWREELLEDLEAAPPRYIAVARGDVQPWLVGTSQTSDEHLRDSFPALRAFLEQNYAPIQDYDLMILYELGPVAVSAR